MLALLRVIGRPGRNAIPDFSDALARAVCVCWHGGGCTQQKFPVSFFLARGAGEVSHVIAGQPTEVLGHRFVFALAGQHVEWGGGGWGAHTKTESNLGLNAARCTLVQRLLSEIKRFEKVCVFSFRLLGFMVAFFCVLLWVPESIARVYGNKSRGVQHSYDITALIPPPPYILFDRLWRWYLASFFFPPPWSPLWWRLNVQYQVTAGFCFSQFFLLSFKKKNKKAWVWLSDLPPPPSSSLNYRAPLQSESFVK